MSNLKPDIDNLSRRIGNWFVNTLSNDGTDAPRALELLSLEDRVLYSAGPLPLELVASADTSVPEVSSAEFLEGVESNFDLIENSIHEISAYDLDNVIAAETDLSIAFEGAGFEYAATELVFVDVSVEGYEQLVDDLMEQRTNRALEVFYLESGRNSLEQISFTLENRKGIAAVHLVSHGRDGELYLGDDIVNANRLSQYESEFAIWKAALADDADILIYGCDVAETEYGQRFVERFSQVTDADVAASSDVTGHQSHGGDWELEYQVGTIDSTQVFSVNIIESWNHLLPVTASPDSYSVDENSSLTQNVLTNDSNSGGGGLSVFETSTPQNGQLTINSDGSFEYAPDPDFHGSDTFTYSAGEPVSSLQHYWGLDGNANDLVGDADGTIDGATASSGAMLFDGDDLIEIEDITYSDSFTLSFDFRLDDLSGNGYQSLYSHGANGVQNSLNIYVGEESTFLFDNILKTAIFDGNDTNPFLSNNNEHNIDVSSFDPTAWYTYTLVVEHGVGSKVFINGVEETSSDIAADGINPAGSVFLGVAENGSRSFTGALDSLQIYDRALSDSEVNDPFVAGLVTTTVDIEVNPVTEIRGQVFEDVIGDGQKDGADAGVAGVEVKLYRDDGPAGADDGDLEIDSVTTDGFGNYEFTGLQHNQDYFVVVNSKTVSASAGLNTPGNDSHVWAEQTYGDGGAKFGGLHAGVSDDFSLLSTSEHVSTVSVPLSVTNGLGSVDFGFSFNVVTNVAGGDDRDDDLANVRSVQGSLRQFIVNANEIMDQNAMRFVPGTGATEIQGTDSWWMIEVSEALPEILDARTTIDGRAYASDGVTFLNSNSARYGVSDPLGTGTGADAVIGTGADGVFGTADDGVSAFDETAGADGIVGTADDTDLDGLDAPELEIRDQIGGATLNQGLVVNASDFELAYISIHGFGSSSEGANVVIGSDAGNAHIHHSFIGSGAGSFSNPTDSVNGLFNIFVDRADDGLIEHNLIGFAAKSGVRLKGDIDGTNGADHWQIRENEIRSNGLTSSNHDGIDINYSVGVEITDNLIVDNQGYGVDIARSFGDFVISSNTIVNNGGGGGTEQGGIRLFGNNNVIEHNVIAENQGSGVVVVAGYTSSSGYTNPASTENLISQNAFFSNSGIAIDLVESSPTNSEFNGGDGESVNDDVSDFDAGNIGVDHPVLSETKIVANELIVSGVSKTYSYMEVYLAAPADNEGAIYLGRLDPFLRNFSTGEFKAKLVEPASGWPDGLVGGNVSVIAIDVDSNTSEFSAVSQVIAQPDAVNSEVTTQEDVAYTFSIGDFGFSDLDDAGMDSIVVESLPDNGKLFLEANEVVAAEIPLTVSKSELDAGSLRFVPSPDANGEGNGDFIYATFEFRVDDGTLLSADVAEMAISVTPVNDAPDSVNVSVIGAEDDTYVAITLAGTDIDGTVDEVVVETLPANGILYSDLALTQIVLLGEKFPAVGEALDLYFVPDPDWNGDTTFEYSVIDDQGRGENNFATTTVQITAENDAPVAADVVASGAEDDAVIAISLTGSDVDGDVNQVVLENLPSNGDLYLDASLTMLADPMIGYLATGGGLELYFVPAANWDGATIFNYSVLDEFGLKSVVPATATINVQSANDAPQVFGAAVSGVEDGPPIAIDLVGSDLDGAVESFSISSALANGKLYLDAGQTTEIVSGQSYLATGETLTIYYVADSDWNGSASFEYVAVDDEGGITSADEAALVTIDISAVDDETNVNDDVIRLASGVVVVDQGVLLANDIDIDNDRSEFEIVITRQPTAGFVELLGGELTFTPGANFDGDTTFEYVVEVNGVASESAQVTIVAPATLVPIPAEPAEVVAEEEEENSTSEELVGSIAGPASDSIEVSGNPLAGRVQPSAGLFVIGREKVESVAERIQDINLIEDQNIDVRYSSNNRSSEATIDNFYGLVETAAGTELSQFESTLFAGLVWDNLDSAKQEFLTQQMQIGVPEIAASAASFLTVGYLAWVIRGGVLLTTFVSSMPAWSNFDILSVIENASAGESIEQMVDS